MEEVRSSSRVEAAWSRLVEEEMEWERARRRWSTIVDQPREGSFETRRRRLICEIWASLAMAKDRSPC